MADHPSELWEIGSICTKELARDHGMEPFCSCPKCRAEQAEKEYMEAIAREIGDEA